MNDIIPDIDIPWGITKVTVPTNEFLVLNVCLLFFFYKMVLGM